MQSDGVERKKASTHLDNTDAIPGEEEAARGLQGVHGAGVPSLHLADDVLRVGRRGANVRNS